MNAKRRILIVDDDASIRTTARTVLERAGYEVATARNGCEAISLIAANDYDVVLLDVMMPKLNGLAVVAQLRKENSPVLAHTYLLTTGNAALSMISRCAVSLPSHSTFTRSWLKRKTASGIEGAAPWPRGAARSS